MVEVEVVKVVVKLVLVVVVVVVVIVDVVEMGSATVNPNQREQNVYISLLVVF
jgi:hypothetical protein